APESGMLASVTVSAAPTGLDTAEAALLRQMLEQAGGDRHHAADLLGVSLQSLELRLSRLSPGEIA
ncbi:MAG: helix-turn-helix domain-containing protein, partial [Acidithiobacillus sp.]